MRTRDGRSLTTLRAARDFLEDYRNTFPALLESDPGRRLNDVISTVDAHAAAQTAHTMRVDGLVQTQETICAALRDDHMAAIARIARADLPHTPEFRVLRMPAGRPTVARLASAAGDMAGMAERFADAFVSAGLPPTFVDDTRAAIRALLAARVEATLTRAKRRGAKRGIEVTIVQGRQVLKELDKLVRRECRGDAALVAHWQAVIAQPRLGRPRK